MLNSIMQTLLTIRRRMARTENVPSGVRPTASILTFIHVPIASCGVLIHHGCLLFMLMLMQRLVQSALVQSHPPHSRAAHRSCSIAETEFHTSRPASPAILPPLWLSCLH